MKRILSLVIVLSLLLSVSRPVFCSAEEPSFKGSNDPELLEYIRDTVYSSLVSDLTEEDCFVENVETVYLSDEYIARISFNHMQNRYFGYTISELDAQFDGEKYIFYYDGNHGTDVTAIEHVDDDTFLSDIVKNVSIGAGVILVCVTATLVAGAIGPKALAVKMIFAVAAEKAGEYAASGALLGGVSAGVVTAYKTGDPKEAMKAAALSASEGFKWGAIIGAATGSALEGFDLHSATLNGLTMNEAARIQQESGYPMSIIKQLHSVQEYQVLKDAGLQSQMVGGKLALVRQDIDLYNVLDEYGRNNFARLSQGLNPIDASGQTFQWHHIGQNNDATLALLTANEHKDGALHGFKVLSEIDRKAFDEYKREVLNKDLLRWLTESI